MLWNRPWNMSPPTVGQQLPWSSAPRTSPRQAAPSSTSTRTVCCPCPDCLFESAGHFEIPGPMPGPEPWARGMTTAGSLIPEHLTPAAANADTDQGAVEGECEEPAPGGQAGQNTGGDAPEHDRELAEEEPTAVGQKADRGHVVPFRAGTSAAAMAVLSSTLALDSNLDDDLDEWFATVPKRPRIAVLGPPLVVANGPAPSGPVSYTHLRA